MVYAKTILALPGQVSLHALARVPGPSTMDPKYGQAIAQNRKRKPPPCRHSGGFQVSNSHAGSKPAGNQKS